MLGILGKKTGMTQMFREDGTLVAVTSIIAGPCVVLQVKTKENDGYCAAQLGFGEKKKNRTNKAETGHCKKANANAPRFKKEIKITEGEKVEVGQKIEVDIFKEGDFVDVTGLSIGRGFQGGIKRWNWSGGPSGHGSMSHRRPGSIGSNTDPGRVFRGHHLPGHLGNERITVQNMEVMKIDKEKNTLTLKGAVPGHKGAYLVIRKAKKK